MGHSVARYVCSLAPLTLSAALRFTVLALLACFVHKLAHSLGSLPRGTVEILEHVFTLLSRSTGTNAFFVFTGNTPLVSGLTLFNGKKRVFVHHQKHALS